MFHDVKSKLRLDLPSEAGLVVLLLATDTHCTLRAEEKTEWFVFLDPL